MSRIAADFTAMAALAGLADRLHASVEEAVTATLEASHSVGLAASALADPAGAAGCEWRLLEVRDGPDGLRWIAAELTGLRALLWAAVAAYREADAAAAAGQAWLTRHPGTIDGLIGLVTAATGRSERQLAAALAAGYPDGVPAVTEVATAAAVPPPRTVADLLAGLERRADISNRWSPAPSSATAGLPAGYDDGTIDIRRLSGPDGVAWIVDLPGTSRWDLPGAAADPHREHDPADFGGDVRLMAGESTCYERGVLEALRRVGPRSGEPVLLAGHSQGGMVAMGVAAVLARRGFHPLVLTAGSPISTVPRPPGVRVLALENRTDVVPHLDGTPDPAGDPDWVTVRFTADEGGIGADHSFAAYRVGATIAGTSPDPAVRRWLAAARPFLEATAVSRRAFRIQRIPGSG